MGNVSSRACPECSDICLRLFLMGLASRSVYVHADALVVLTRVTCVNLKAWCHLLHRTTTSSPPARPSSLPPFLTPSLHHSSNSSCSIPPFLPLSLPPMQPSSCLLLLTPAASSSVFFPLPPARFAQRRTLGRGDGALIVAYQKLSLPLATAGYENDSLSVKPMSLPQWPRRNCRRHNGKVAKQMGLARRPHPPRTEQSE